MKITVLGAGGWGIALALSAYRNNNDVTIWSPFKQEVESLCENRESPKLLSGVKIPDGILITDDFSCAENVDAVVTAVPSIALAETAKRLGNVINLNLVINVSKGFDLESGRRLSEILSEYVSAPIVVLSGPSHAEEVARMVPTSVVAASKNTEASDKVMKIFSSKFLRIYSNDDIVGVELGGALKNVIAVAAGFCDGMGFGDNTKAALMTRGLTEIARLGVALGATERTFAGLTGLGDLIVTCTSRHSRNHRFGEMVGRGVPVDTALKEVGTVEGYYACKIVYEEYSHKLNVEMPIIEQCYMALFKNADVSKAVENLMLRPNRDEHENMWIK